jgi:hypothetical protein
VEENNKLHQFGMETKEKIVNNCKKLINNLSKNSFYRRPILLYLIESLEKHKVLEVFQISERFYGRIYENIGNSLIETKYTMEVKNKSFTRTIGGNSKNFGRYSSQTK